MTTTETQQTVGALTGLFSNLDQTFEAADAVCELLGVADLTDAPQKVQELQAELAAAKQS